MNGLLPQITTLAAEFESAVPALKPGLDRGLLSSVFTAFSLYEHSAEEKWKSLADHSFMLLEKSLEHLDDISFRDGAVGIGWGIEHLASLGYLKLNTDRYLEDFDDLVYSLTLSDGLSLSVDTGALGLFNYLIKRYDSRNGQSHRYRKIYYQDCLVTLSDIIGEKIKEQVDGRKPMAAEEIENLCHALISLSSFWNYQINRPTTEAGIYDAVTLLEEQMEQYKEDDYREGNTLILLHMHYAYLYSGAIFGNERWYQNGSQNFIREFKNYASIASDKLTELLSVTVRAQNIIAGKLLVSKHDLDGFIDFIGRHLQYTRDKQSLLRFMIAFENVKCLPQADLPYI